MENQERTFTVSVIANNCECQMSKFNTWFQCVCKN